MTGKAKTLSAFKLGDQEEERRLEYHVPNKVCRMLTRDSQYAQRRGNKVNIGIVREDTIKTVTPWGGKDVLIVKEE